MVDLIYHSVERLASICSFDKKGAFLDFVEPCLSIMRAKAMTLIFGLLKNY